MRQLKVTVKEHDIQQLIIDKCMDAGVPGGWASNKHIEDDCFNKKYGGVCFLNDEVTRFGESSHVADTDEWIEVTIGDFISEATGRVFIGKTEVKKAVDGVKIGKYQISRSKLRQICRLISLECIGRD